MIEYLLKPRGALTVGLILLVGGSALGAFLSPLLIEATITQPTPMVQGFLALVSGLVSWLAAMLPLVGAALLAAAIVLLKIDRQPR